MSDCYCYACGIVPSSCASGNSPYRASVKISGITSDELTDRYLEGVASAIHMGDLSKIHIDSVEGAWVLSLYANPQTLSCATRVAHYLFQVD
jgi:hypothetical protein